MQPNQSFIMPVFFSGDASAQGIGGSDPVAAANVVTCTGHKPNMAKGFVQVDLKITESTVPENVGRSCRIFVRHPEQGMNPKMILARESEHKSIKISFLPPGEQDAKRPAINAAKGNIQFNWDFVGSTARIWFEPGNDDASEDRSHPSYGQRFSVCRWLDATQYHALSTGQAVQGLRNSPLKGGNAATSGASISTAPFAPAPTPVAPAYAAPVSGMAPVAPVAPAAPAAPVAPAANAASMML